MAVLQDETASWTTGYKTNYWLSLVPGRRGDLVEMAGEPKAKEDLSKLVRAHGFVPKDLGTVGECAALEVAFDHRGRFGRVKSGERVDIQGLS